MSDAPHRRTADRLLLLITGLIVLLWGLLWLWRVDRGPDYPPGNPRFGLAFISAPDNLAGRARYEGALRAGAAWDRWPLYWHWVDQGGYVGQHPGGFHNYDTLVYQDIAHGLTPVAILLGTPARFATAPSPDAAGQPGGQPPLPVHMDAATMATTAPAGLFEPIFADGSDDPAPGKAINPANPWAVFVFDTVERYRPGGQQARHRRWPAGAGIRHWEIWNEPDYQLFWQGTVEEYYRLLEVGYKAVKASDPAATVLLGGQAFYDKPDWLSSLLRLTQGDPGRAYFDVFSFHHYLSIYQSERQLRTVRQSLDAYGLSHIPIWITESGVSVWDDYPATAYDVSPAAPLRGTMAEQAAYVIQQPAVAFFHGVERVFHFMLHDDCGDGPSSAYGLRRNFDDSVCNPSDGQPRPAYAAYQLAASQFRELIPLWRQQQAGTGQLAFYRPDDRSRLVVMWATGGLSATTTLSATGRSARLYWVDPATSAPVTTTLAPAQKLYTVTLPPATNQNSILPDDSSFQIGGRPLLLVEADTEPPTAQLAPLPLTSTERIFVRWQGSDPGSGIAGYRLWAGRADGPLRPWLTDTTVTSATFSGESGQTYSFAVSAVDRAGNAPPPPAAPQTTTRVVPGIPVSGTVVGPGGQPVVAATVTISGPHTYQRIAAGADGRWGPVPLRPGPHIFSAKAAGYGRWSSPRHLTLGAAAEVLLTLPPAANSLGAADFEGNQLWSMWRWAGQVNQSADAFDGQWALRLGDGRGEAAPCPGQGETGQRWLLGQTVSIPSGQPHLSFVYKIDTAQPSAANRLLVKIVEDEQETVVIEAWQAANWTPVSVDLEPWQGQTGSLQFEVFRCEATLFKVTLDRVGVGSQSNR